MGIKNTDMEEPEKRGCVIENVKPEIDCGRFPIKRVVDEKITVEADIFSDGHDSISAKLLYKSLEDSGWDEVDMPHIMNDRWRGSFFVTKVGKYAYTIKAWVNRFRTWQQDLKKKFDSNQDIKIDIETGINLIKNAFRNIEKGEDKKKMSEFIKSINDFHVKDPKKAVLISLSDELTILMNKYLEKSETIYSKELEVIVDRKMALFSAWYEMFPRSASKKGKHGTFKDCEELIPEISGMGFDIIYFPPIHPIGATNRKGKNNSLKCKPDEPGTPWAIGYKEGGHKAIHPQLGTFEDFESLVKTAKENKLEIAMDIAFQCSQDHPYIKDHPEWFKWRPDNTIQHAENPPKKYEDIVPFNFETNDRLSLWRELKSIVIFWVGKGVRIFRVDNPHTKPFNFWEWLISDVKKSYPDVIFLSEAFTRPKIMHYLAKVGFTQSYTYFTWRSTKWEFTQYLSELTQTELKEFFRPNFWPNTPDILMPYLQTGGKPAFMIRLVLAGTLSSNYGIYGPAYELCINQGLPGKEEYLDSEKYEIKHRDEDTSGNIKDFISLINKTRKENKALQETNNIKLYSIDNENLIAYSKTTEDLANIILVIVNLDPLNKQSGWLRLPLNELNITSESYDVYDLLTEKKYSWKGERNYIELDPKKMPAHVLKVNNKN